MDIPEACTLPDAERPLRLAEFETLFARSASSARSVERIGPQHLRLTLTGGPELEATVRDLAAREASCCSLFTFTVTAEQAGLVRFDIEVPAAHADVVDAMQRMATGS